MLETNVKSNTARAAFKQYSQDGHITRGEGNILASIMGMDSNAFWAKFDTDGRGSIQGNELSQLKNAIYGPPGGNLTELAFTQFSKDGQISFMEGYILAVIMRMDPQTFWAKFDTDGGGSIQGNELSQLKNTIYGPPDGPPGGNVAETAFKEYSQDGHITRGEGNILSRIMGMDPNAFWAKFDADGRGSIQGNELIKLEKSIKEISWPSNIESRTPDGKFGPAQQLWGDCWFMSCLAAVANDEEGVKILRQNLKNGDGGYQVTFAGLPNHEPVFISDAQLKKCLDTNGGDADSRIVELAANQYFETKGNFKSLFNACCLKMGCSNEKAESVLQEFCRINNIKDPMTYNPMKDGGLPVLGYFMLAGMISTSASQQLKRSDIEKFLDQYITNDKDGASVVISGKENPLGPGLETRTVGILWDVIRTNITSDGTVDQQERNFLTALDKWLGTNSKNDLDTLQSAAGKLKHKHFNKFVSLLPKARKEMLQPHIDVLKSGVNELLTGGIGYIGFTGGHAGIIKGIDKEAGTFTYAEPNYPKMVHTGKLDNLIEAVLSGKILLGAVEPERKDVLLLLDPDKGKQKPVAFDSADVQWLKIPPSQLPDAGVS